MACSFPMISRIQHFGKPSRIFSARFASMSAANRSEGSIANAFVSLSKGQVELPPRFAELKREITAGNGDLILNSWHRLLRHIQLKTIPRIAQFSSSAVPEVQFEDIKKNGGGLPDQAKELLKDCGTIVVRSLVPEHMALQWKQSVRDYVHTNPSTKGFPADNIQVYELYWTRAQLEARSHENMMITQTALNKVWKKHADDRVVLAEPVAYCDRLRIRTPGDKSFNLGPHLDGGSIERWEDPEYRKCYADILQGRWEEHDAWDVGPRLKANFDMYSGPGGCSAFRSYQGWLSLSDCAPTNGTLRVLPDLRASTAYTLLRPFVTQVGGNWALDTSPVFHGAAMGAGQELLPQQHSHLSPHGFVSIPAVRPGDAVFWHCDVAHMVESSHLGDRDASVIYIPVVPLCDTNIMYLKRQRENFLEGRPPPDFPGGLGESQHVGRGTVDDLCEAGKRAMGCHAFDSSNASTPGEKAAYEFADKTLGI